MFPGSLPKVRPGPKPEAGHRHLHQAKTNLNDRCISWLVEASLPGTGCGRNHLVAIKPAFLLTCSCPDVCLAFLDARNRTSLMVRCWVCQSSITTTQHRVFRCLCLWLHSYPLSSVPRHWNTCFPLTRATCPPTTLSCSAPSSVP